MPPNTAMRDGSGITASPAWVGAECAVLVASKARVVAQRVWNRCICQSRAEASIRRCDQDRAYVHAAIRHDSAVIANQVALIKADHHLGCDAFLRPVAALSLCL